MAARKKIERTVFSWGHGPSGQLGIGIEGQVDIPTEVDSLRNEKLLDIVASKSNSAAILEDGTLMTWGKSLWGMLGSSSQNMIGNQKIPRISEKSIGIQFKQVSIGKGHCAAVTKDGKLYTWGSIDHGKLGHHLEILFEKVRVRDKIIRGEGRSFVGEPTLVDDLDDVKQVACGPQYTIIVKNNGEVYTMGKSTKGGLGLGKAEMESFQLQKLDFGNSKIEKIQSGSDFNIALDSKGKLYSWGVNDSGQLGHQEGFFCFKPKKILNLYRKTIVDFSCGENFVCAIDDVGDVYSWGCGSYGQLGHGNKNNLSTPLRIHDLEEAKQVSCGEGHSGVLTKSGDLYMFGFGRNGQIGRGDQVESSAFDKKNTGES